MMINLQKLFRYNEHYRQLVYFAFIGVVCAGIYFVILATMLEHFKFAYRPSVSFAFVVSTCVNFIGNRNFTFKQRHASVIRHSQKYVIMLLVSYITTITVVEFGITVLGQSAYIGSIVAIGFSALLRFYLSKFWVFS